MTNDAGDNEQRYREWLLWIKIAIVRDEDRSTSVSTTSLVKYLTSNSETHIFLLLMNNVRREPDNCLPTSLQELPFLVDDNCDE